MGCLCQRLCDFALQTRQADVEMGLQEVAPSLIHKSTSASMASSAGSVICNFPASLFIALLKQANQPTPKQLLRIRAAGLGARARECPGGHLRYGRRHPGHPLRGFWSCTALFRVGSWFSVSVWPMSATARLSSETIAGWAARLPRRDRPAAVSVASALTAVDVKDLARHEAGRTRGRGSRR